MEEIDFGESLQREDLTPQERRSRIARLLAEGVLRRRADRRRAGAPAEHQHGESGPLDLSQPVRPCGSRG